MYNRGMVITCKRARRVPTPVRWLVMRWFNQHAAAHPGPEVLRVCMRSVSVPSPHRVDPACEPALRRILSIVCVLENGERDE